MNDRSRETYEPIAMENDDFAQLLQAYQAGDAQARNELFTAFMPRIAGLLKKYLRNPGLLDDVKGSVVVSFLANHGADLAKVTDADDLWHLFAAITLRHCNKHNKRGYRANQRGATIPIEGGSGDSSTPQGYVPVDPELTPDMKAAVNDLILTCNKALTHRQQLILTEHLGGAENESIAQSVEISPSTVVRELEKIRSILNRLAGEDDDEVSP
jgi:hypothetical protein